MCKTDAGGELTQVLDANLKSEFNVTIAYDGADGANDALKVYGYLQTQFGNDFDLKRAVFSMDAICRGKTRHPERSPDMIIVASRRFGSLPCPLVDWLKERLSGAAERPVALAAVVNKGSARQASAAYSELEELAMAAGATFFHREPVMAEEGRTSGGEAGVKGRWGLNE